MFSEISTLQIRIDSAGLDKAERGLMKLESQGKRAERATDGLTNRFKILNTTAKTSVAILGGIAIGKITSDFISVNKEFDRLNASLVTVTGSTEAANAAFETLQEFSKETPFQISEVTEAFIKMKSMGLDASEEALLSYGNTASAMGKDLNQMIEAVADAATGEFERLRDFGIKARSQGENVQFTFQEVTTTVKKSASDIEGYLRNIGDTKFAGGVTRQIDTLGGKISNLEGAWEQFIRSIGESGAISVTTGLIEGLTTSVNNFSNAIKLAKSFSEGEVGFWEWISASPEDATSILDRIGDLGAERKAIIHARNELEKYEAELAMGGSNPARVKWLKDEITYLKEGISEFETYLASKKKPVPASQNTATAEITTPTKPDVNATRDYESVVNDLMTEREAIEVEYQNRIKIIESYTDQTIEERERLKTRALQIRNEEMAKLSEGRKRDYSDLVRSLMTEKEAVEASYQERLQIISENTDKSADELEKLRSRAKTIRDNEFAEIEKRRTAEYDSLVRALWSEEESILASYQRRMKIIEDNAPDQDTKDTLMGRLNDQFATDSLGEWSQPDTHQEELDKINDFYSRRRELILSNSALTETQRTELETQLTQERNEKLSALERERQEQIFSASASLFDGLAGISETFAGEQSGIYKAMFAASKAFAIADSIIKIQQGIASAAANPWPSNIAAMASVVSATSSIVSTISGTNYSGAYDGGGYIPAGSFGIAGELGPEIINGPAHVTSRKDTEAILKDAGQQQAPAPVNNIRIVNVADPAAAGDYLGSVAGEKIVMNHIKHNATSIKSILQ